MSEIKKKIGKTAISLLIATLTFAGVTGFFNKKEKHSSTPTEKNTLLHTLPGQENAGSIPETFKNRPLQGPNAPTQQEIESQ
jgi:hypothetical protein